jgi:hypothetical protein
LSMTAVARMPSSLVICDDRASATLLTMASSLSSEFPDSVAFSLPGLMRPDLTRSVNEVDLAL